jgi:hypothetical protein
VSIPISAAAEIGLDTIFLRTGEPEVLGDTPDELVV